MEAAIIPGWLRARSGTYLEPTRFRTSRPRVHYTAGFDTRILPWNVYGIFRDDYTWRVSAAGDVSARYFAWTLGLGSWY